MAAREKFLLVSLSESKTKELAQTVANETCRKILDYLADKDSTESELFEKLNIPISTVHYNLQQLKKAGLVISEEYHYSKKGKEVNHYKLANKYIIIAPKSTYGIKEKLKSILPVALIAAIGAGFIQFFSKGLGTFSATQEVSRGVLEEAVMTSEKAAIAAPEAAADAAHMLAQEAANNLTTTPIQVIVEPSIFSNIALWFFIGAAIAIILYLIIDWIRNRK